MPSLAEINGRTAQSGGAPAAAAEYYYAYSADYRNDTSALPILSPPASEFAAPASFSVTFAGAAASGTGTQSSPWNAAQLAAQFVGGAGNTTLKDAALASTGGVIVDIIGSGTYRGTLDPGFDNATGKRVTLRARVDLGVVATVSAMEPLSVVSDGVYGGIEMFVANLPAGFVIPDYTPTGGGNPFRCRSRYWAVVDDAAYREEYTTTTDSTNLANLRSRTTGGWFCVDRTNKKIYFKPASNNLLLELPNSTARAITADHRPSFASRTIEVSHRGYTYQAVESNGTDGKRRAGWNLIGLKLRGGYGRWQLSAVNLGPNTDLRYCEVTHCSNGGIRMGASTSGSVDNINIVGTRVAWTGQNGIVATKVDGRFGGDTIDCLVEYCNHKNFDAFYEAGASKYTVGRYRVINSIARDCWGYGWWFDEKFWDCSFEYCRAHDCDAPAFSTEVGDVSVMHSCIAYFSGFTYRSSKPHQSVGLLAQNGGVWMSGRNVLVRNNQNIGIREDTGRYSSDPRNTAKGSRIWGCEIVADNDSSNAACAAWFVAGASPYTTFSQAQDPTQQSGHNNYYTRPSGFNFERWNNAGDTTTPWQHTGETSYRGTSNHMYFEKNSVFRPNTDAGVAALLAEFAIPTVRNAMGRNPYDLP